MTTMTLHNERSLSQRSLRWVAIAGAALGAVLYFSWLLEVVFNRTLPDPDIYLSELSALDQPYGAWFRACDMATAIVLVITAAAGLAGVRGGRWNRIGWWALGVFAVATGIDSNMWPLECAQHDPACAARLAADAVPLSDHLHLLSSTIVVVASMVSLLAFLVADRADHTPAPLRRAGRLIFAALIATSIWAGIAMAIEDSTHHITHIGIAQRAELATIAGWLIYVALRTARTRARAGNTSSATAKWMPIRFRAANSAVAAVR